MHYQSWKVCRCMNQSRLGFLSRAFSGVFFVAFSTVTFFTARFRAGFIGFVSSFSGSLTDGIVVSSVISYCVTVQTKPPTIGVLIGGLLMSVFYLKILITTPAPTVLPPSLIAKRCCSCKATGTINLIFKFTVSPGITISAPSGSSTSPVTSVVRI